MKTTIFIIALVAFARCGDSDPNADVVALGNQSFQEVLVTLPSRFIEGMVEVPTEEGALGRNKSGYFHVRFQLGVATLGAYATYFKSEEALAHLASSIAYSFRHQKNEGDFTVEVPASLQHLGTPEASDLASGIAFFGAALGQSLTLLKASEWYEALPATYAAKKVIADHQSRVQAMINFLKPQTSVLLDIDLRATNRLFWDAMCFYAIGSYLDDEEAKEIGLNFVTTALAQQTSEGFFIENGGFDSSYNGVSLYFGAMLYSMMPESTLKAELGNALVKNADWQMSRIEANGEITTEGNTRVFPGGEKFLGAEKSVAWKDTVLAFYWLHALSGNQQYQMAADKVIAYYE